MSPDTRRQYSLPAPPTLRKTRRPIAYRAAMRLDASFVVPVDRARAFDYIAEGRNALASHPKGTTIEQQPPGPAGLGTTFVVHIPGRPTYTTRISVFERPVQLEFISAFEGQSPSRTSWMFINEAAGTRVTLESEIALVGPGWLKPLAGLLTLAAWPLVLIRMWKIRRRITEDLSRTR
jgi:hypothetical protein